MSKSVEAKQVAHLQLDAAQHFFLAIHNGSQIHISGDLSPMDMVIAILTALRAIGVSQEDAVQVISEQAAHIWSQGSGKGVIRKLNG